MNSFKQQALLLTAIMLFLSAITVFFISVGSPGEQEAEEDSGSLLPQVEVTQPQGDGLVDQSLRGLILLYEDIQTGLSAISDQEETLNETVNESG